MDYKKAVETCTHGQAPTCADACPFQLDIRNLIDRVRRGSFDSAYRLLRDAMVFPDTALKLCPAPCADACERKVCDAPVRLRDLELAAIRLAKRKDPLLLNVPPKAERIAVIGAGISGLACALRLSSRGYAVTVYEKSARIGGRLWERFADGAFLEEIQAQFQHTNCVFQTSTEITDPSALDADAIYIATGRGGADFSTGGNALPGGGLLGNAGVFALSQGIDAANHMETFLKTGAMPAWSAPDARPANRLDPALLAYMPPVSPSGESYTAEEVAGEAARCLKCDCDACARRCPLIIHYRKFPDRIASETEATVRPTDLLVNRYATRMVASCDQCGLCAEACPQGVDLRAILADAKREMKAKGDLPSGFSAFWLEDMAHAEENAFFVKGDGGTDLLSHLYFPGCRLGAADPQYVTESYQRLLKKHPGTALLADCCGAPAYWAGDMRLFDEKAAKLRREWENMGSPSIICACPTCANMLRRILSKCDIQSLYAMDLGAEDAGAAGAEKEAVIFHPCAARSDHPARQGVRRILEGAGYRIAPLSSELANPLCCGWGGQYKIANPLMSEETASRNAALSDAPYVTYCVNCRDTLAETGKQAWHILDILLGFETTRTPLTHSARRANRELLLHTMTGGRRDMTGAPESQPAEPMLYLDEALRKKLSDDWILEEDVLAAIIHCEHENRNIFNGVSGAYTGHMRLRRLTHWVEYKPEGNGYRLLNAYAHKVEIED